MIAELAKGKWHTARDAWNWLGSKFDLGDMKESTIYNYLGKCAGRLKATRPCNPEKDPEAEAASRVTLADQIENSTSPPESRSDCGCMTKCATVFILSPVRCGVCAGSEPSPPCGYAIRTAISTELWKWVAANSSSPRPSTRNGISAFSDKSPPKTPTLFTLSSETVRG